MTQEAAKYLLVYKCRKNHSTRLHLLSTSRWSFACCRNFSRLQGTACTSAEPKTNTHLFSKLKRAFINLQRNGWGAVEEVAKNLKMSFSMAGFPVSEDVTFWASQSMFFSCVWRLLFITIIIHITVDPQTGSVPPPHPTPPLPSNSQQVEFPEGTFWSFHDFIRSFVGNVHSKHREEFCHSSEQLIYTRIVRTIMILSTQTHTHTHAAHILMWRNSSHHS